MKSMGRKGSLLCLLAIVALAAGCGGTAKPKPKPKPLSGEAAKPASQIFADMKNAVAAANSAHAVGSATGGNGSLAVTIRRNGRAYGNFETGPGANVKVILLGSKIYLYGNPGFWASFGAAGLPLRRITDHWVEASAADLPFKGLVGLLTWSSFTGRLNLTGKLVKKGVRTYLGKKAIVLRDSDPTEKGTLYVSATGKPYPLAIVGGAAGVTITFDHWNEPVSIPGKPKGAKPIFPKSG